MTPGAATLPGTDPPPAVEALPAAEPPPATDPPPVAEALPAGAPGRLGPMPWRATITSAFVVTLIRPASWVFGLLGFLAGGGLVIVAWPILVLPTATGLQNDLGTPVSTLVVGTPSFGLVALIVAGLVFGVATLVLATWVGAWAERQGIALALEAAAEEGFLAPRPDLAGAPGPGRIALVRLLALVPVVAVFVLAWQPIYDAAYHELILPDDLVTPLPLRVIRAVPGLLAALGVTWLVADAAAAIAVRRLVLDRRPVLAAWLLGWAGVIRRPHRILASALVGVTVVVLLVGPALLASAGGWTHVRDAFLDGRDTPGVLAALAIWVAMWLGGLVLAGVAAAFRTAAWTFEVARR